MAINAPWAPIEATLHSAIRVTQQLLPSGHGTLPVSLVLLPELGGGWVSCAPLHEASTLVSSFVTAREAVLVFGAVEAPAGVSAAQAIAGRWRAGDPQAVQAMEGCFVAVLIDRMAREVTLVGDLTGRRRLRYLVDGASLWVSPHEVPIVATRRCSLTYDLAAARSIAACEWSLQGRSLLRALETTHPARRVRWRQGRTEALNAPPMDLRARLDPGDRHAHAEQIERMIAHARAQARGFASGAGTLVADLTAGIDTRTVLGLLLSVASPSRLLVESRGEPGSLDVRVARVLAARSGLRTSHPPFHVPSPQTFIAHCDLLAFYMNGDISGKRAVAALPLMAASAAAHAHGMGGGILKNLYYRQEWRDAAHQPVEAAFDALWPRLRKRFAALPWPDAQGAQEAFEGDVRQAFEAWIPLSGNGYDLLDLFYLYERQRVWGAMPACLPWLHGYWSPFESPGLTRMAYRLPAPLQRFCAFHRVVIRRYVPGGSWMRVNGKRRPWLEGPGRARAALRALDRVGLRCAMRLPRAARWTPSRDVEQLRAEAFAGPLASTMRDLLEVRGGFGEALFGADGINRLLDDHIHRRQNRLAVLGCLVTMERWRVMVEQAARGGAGDAAHAPSPLFTTVEGR